MPSAFSESISASKRSVASINGARAVSCEPIWQSIPCTSRLGKLCAKRYTCAARSKVIPNLLSRRPVEM
ncbi:Uncharacterised protein [Vibrio cholerae]|nr:Uncharacterised protein [Vibrio cholerae]CSB62873.1 Uncharacterised protein [Vibrio cholerae]CSC03332.1 Uncharacterised protein [Vibrio cholerae]CSI83735.1 Uncharacterised protein [Vibrio cholerae]